jgi:hypothetical protein
MSSTAEVGASKVGSRVAVSLLRLKKFTGVSWIR